MINGLCIDRSLRSKRIVTQSKFILWSKLARKLRPIHKIMRTDIADQLGSPTREVPLRGLGTFQANAQSYPQEAVKQGVIHALKTGYRHIDTAWSYGDGQMEREVGEAIRDSRIPRGEIFVVTKL